MGRNPGFVEDVHGGAMLETAVVFTAFLMVFFGVMDCSRALYADVYVAYAARAAARYAMVRGSSFAGTTCATPGTSSCDATSANLQAFVMAHAPLGISPASALTTTATWPGIDATGAACSTTYGVNSPGCLVQVRVTYNFNFVLPLLPKNTLPLSSTSAVTIAQ